MGPFDPVHEHFIHGLFELGPSARCGVVIAVFVLTRNSAGRKFVTWRMFPLLWSLSRDYAHHDRIRAVKTFETALVIFQASESCTGMVQISVLYSLLRRLTCSTLSCHMCRIFPNRYLVMTILVLTSVMQPSPSSKINPTAVGTCITTNFVLMAPPTSPLVGPFACLLSLYN